MSFLALMIHAIQAAQTNAGCVAPVSLPLETDVRALFPWDGAFQYAQ